MELTAHHYLSIVELTARTHHSVVIGMAGETNAIIEIVQSKKNTIAIVCFGIPINLIVVFIIYYSCRGNPSIK